MVNKHNAFAAAAEFAAGCSILAGASAGMAGGLVAAGALAQLYNCLSGPNKATAQQKIATAVTQTGQYFAAHKINSQQVPDQQKLLEYIGEQLAEKPVSTDYFIKGCNDPKVMAERVVGELPAPDPGLASKPAFRQITQVIMEQAFTEILADRDYFTGLQPALLGAVLAGQQQSRKEAAHTHQELAEIKATLAGLAQNAAPQNRQILNDPDWQAQLQAALLEDETEAKAALASFEQAATAKDPDRRQQLIAQAIDHLEALSKRQMAELAALATAQANKRIIAARTARGLGAAKMLTDTQGALAAYQRAEQLEPDDFWTNIYLARLYIQSGSLRAAGSAGKTALHVAMDNRERTIAFNEIGDVLLAQGDLTGAQEQYQQSLTLTRELAELDTGSAQAKRDLLIVLIKVGEVLQKQNNLSGAAKHYQQCLTLARELAELDTGSAQAKRDVSVSLNKVGDVLLVQGDLTGAQEQYQQSLTLARELAALDTGSAQAKRDVSVSLNKVGDVLLAQGDLTGAQEQYQQCLTLTRQLAELDTGNAEAKRDLFVSLAKISRVLAAQNDRAGACANLRQGRQIIAKLALASPDHPGWQSDLAVADELLAKWDCPSGG